MFFESDSHQMNHISIEKKVEKKKPVSVFDELLLNIECIYGRGDNKREKM